MTLTGRDKKALIALGVAVALIVALKFWLDRRTAVVEAPRPVMSIPLAEKRLARVRQLAAIAPAREQALKKANAELATREKGILKAATAAQAQERLLQIVRRVATSQNPPVEIKGSELGTARAISPDYGETTVSISFECHMEQLVSLLADFTAQPEILSPAELRMNMGNQKQKTVMVRLTVAGVVPRALVPERKAAAL
jgi:hypothetical protein